MALSAHNIPSLNGIRAISVFIVILSHAGLGHLIPGGFGVTIFFFLSGFLITTLLLVERDKYSTINLKQFYIRRFLRLTPPLLVTLAIVYAITALGWNGGGISWDGAAAQLLYFTNYFYIFFQQPGDLPNGTTVLWSLAIEEHFYLIYPVVFLLGFRYLNRSQFAVLLAFICALVLAWRTLLVLVFDAPEARTYNGTDTRIDSIAYGCLMAVAFNPIDKNDGNFSRLAPKHWLMLVASLGLTLLTLVYRDAVFRETLRYSLQGIALMPIFYLVVAKYQSFLFKPLNWSVCNVLGVYSYSLYLIHHAALETYHYNFSHASLMGTVAVIGLCIVYAWGIDRFLDKPLVQVRRKFRH